MAEETLVPAADRPWREVLPLLPLRGVIVFPHMVTPLDVGREKSVRSLEEAMIQERLILLAAQKQAKTNEPGPDDIHEVGTVAEIKQLLKLPDGTIRILVEGLGRARVTEFVREDPFHEVRVERLDRDEPKTAEVEALMRAAGERFEEYVKASKRLPVEVLLSLTAIDDASHLADFIGSQLQIKLEEKQRLLELASARQRLELLLVMLAKEMEILELERKINVRVRKQMEKSQREYYLREQMKAIQKELGEKDERTAEADELRHRIKQAKLPKEVAEKALGEVQRLEKMPPMSAEGGVIRTYVEWILALPWTKKTRDRLDIAVAEQILDEDHYGLEKVKERILEFLAVRQLAEKMKGPILCLVGPPGVGKTSLGRSIARALERKFVRFSLGGVRDEAEIRGHRRTYVGALPGKIIQAMRQAGTQNPVILLDEIDKMTQDFRGDPSSALLEVLDPEQNNTFGDHYLEIPYDLSDVMFITTANVVQNIPRPLLDRMEVITLPGYTEEEKREIAVRHLVPKQLGQHGLKAEQVQFQPSAVARIVAEYTREAGVRQLEREIAAICRKAAKDVVKGAKTPIRVTGAKVAHYLGAPRFRHNPAEQEDKVGVATGLAVTEVGGDLLSIETTPVKGKGQLILTGKLGEVMRESAQAAFSYIRSRAAALGIREDFHEQFDLHIHIPEGAIPKDGPSAGITMATALVSALSGVPVRHEVAMTGEITLRGRVLGIGGLKEKTLAAYRAGIKTVLFPKENEKDVEDIPANVRRRLELIPVEHMDEVLRRALAGGLSPLRSGAYDITAAEDGLPFLPEPAAIPPQ
ncbi:MAG: endopeptidase La [Chitinophagales bacterium]